MKMRTRRRNTMKSPARMAASISSFRCRTFSVGWADAGKYGPDTYNREMDLSQDYCRGLAVWFATRLSAKEDVRKAFPS